ncbi:MAG TPA: NAD(P)-dependent oxidoreductase, partial [Candidatus Eremiobacteraceae bacterium]|nr:NAD(P)-dependent oxidoreductase [Candidatus Eremiobacteraceae bacterium]
MRIAVIGANGQVGSEIVGAARKAGLETIALTHIDCDVTDRPSLDAAFSGLASGDFVANTAAFHRTDACEDDPERAMAVNALGAFNAAAAANERGAGIVFISTDFVFDGSKDSAYVESDTPRPINAYGVSKFAGEMLAAHANPAHYIVRISSVFGVAGASGKGGNFVETIVSKARSGAPIDVVDDIVMAPTYAADAAALMISLLASRAPFGMYHLANKGECSWRAFADAILAESGSEARA